jgi:hypothetical protein
MVKHRNSTTAENEALSDFVEDTQLMHEFTTLLMIGSADRTLWTELRPGSMSA